MKRIVVLDGYAENPGDLSWDGLKKYGDLAVYDRTAFEDDEIIRRIGDAQIVLTNKCPLSRNVIENCRNIEYISVLATGYNCVDYSFAAEKGIPVSNVPTYGTEAVAQHAIALLLEVCAHVGAHSTAVMDGRWETCPDWCFWDYPLIELSGKTIGIIGFGRIGKTTGRIARAMGMRVLATGSRETEEGREIADYTDLNSLLASSDVIALHCPANPDTIGIINKHTISKMKDGVIIINNSRGQLIVEKDLADALASGKVYAAGLDVLSQEPVNPDNPLLKASNCIITPHISWAPLDARRRIMNITESNICLFLEGKPINIVNI